MYKTIRSMTFGFEGAFGVLALVTCVKDKLVGSSVGRGRCLGIAI